MKAEIGEYKSQPTLTLKNGEHDKYGFTFGVKKAKMILEAIAEIQAFVEDNEKPSTGTEPF